MVDALGAYLLFEIGGFGEDRLKRGNIAVVLEKNKVGIRARSGGKRNRRGHGEGG